MEFTPLLIGPHNISVEYGGQSATGSPYTCNVYDASKVKILDVTRMGVVGEELEFTGKIMTLQGHPPNR